MGLGELGDVSRAVAPLRCRADHATTPRIFFTIGAPSDRWRPERANRGSMRVAAGYLPKWARGEPAPRPGGASSGRDERSVEIALEVRKRDVNAQLMHIKAVARKNRRAP